MKKGIIILLLILFIAPQITFAVSWDSLFWNIWTTISQIFNKASDKTQTIEAPLDSVLKPTDAVACAPDWSCSSWSNCVGLKQTRKCTDTKSCGILTNKPEETKSCSLPVSAPAQNPITNPTTNPSANPIPVVFSGTLNIVKNSSYSDQSISIPLTKFKLADFTLTNNTTEPTNLKTIEADLPVGYGNGFYITNLYIAYGENVSLVQNTSSYRNYFNVDYQLPVKGSVNVSVYGDVSSSMPLNSSVIVSLMASGSSANSDTEIYTNSKAVFAGQKITFASPSLSISTSSSISSIRVVVPEQKVLAGVFEFSAKNDVYTINELKFVMPVNYSGSVVKEAILQDNSTNEVLSNLPANIISNGTNNVLSFSNLTAKINSNSKRSVAIYLNLGSVQSKNDTNQNISPILVYAKATGSRGNIIDGYASSYSSFYATNQGISLSSSGLTAKELYVLKSIPIFSSASGIENVITDSVANIFAFKIGADQKGDVAVKQINFVVKITDPNNNLPSLWNFTFWKNGINYTSSVMMGQMINGNYIGLSSNNGIGIGTNTLTLTFLSEENILAGATNTYIIKAEVRRFVKGTTKNPSISTSISADSSRAVNGNYLRMAFTPIYGLAQSASSVDITNSYNLVWSDKSAISFPSHSDANGFSSNDWYNGFKVIGLPLSSQTFYPK